MSKKRANSVWRDFEDLATRIQVTLNKDAEVKHDEKVWDYESEDWRQVDVTIRSKAGCSPYFVAVECRERS